MKPDPLRIEFRKIGGGFTDGPNHRGTLELWGCFLAHATNGQEFLLATGTHDQMFADGIARLEGILARLKKHQP